MAVEFAIWIGRLEKTGQAGEGHAEEFLDPDRGGIAARLAAPLAVLAALLAWLWPIGIGGKMPVGGDVTQFFLGLMGFLSESLRDGRVPVWNDLWGYGFPGLAESQMGVFYPPHALLYGHLNTETAYVISLVLHTLWGGLGTFWASRRMGISRVGSALAAFSWSACGFFLIHLAHPWGYTTGCWMPWAVGLAWSILAPGAPSLHGRRLLLSLVLVLQVLPGHFQLAFQTQVVLGLMVLWAIAEHWGAGLGARRRGEAGRAGPVLRKGRRHRPGGGRRLTPWRRSSSGRRPGLQNWPVPDTISNIYPASPVTPFHLVNFVAPGLFHRSPTWRPLVWDPFHAMPEECLTYIGLVPLFLAVMAMLREFRRDPAVRLLTILALITLVLGLGPYAPGFRSLIALPGFYFFRAPARWSLTMALALAMLAGKGFDRWPEWSRTARSLRWFVGLAVIWIVAVLGLIELADAQHRENADQRGIREPLEAAMAGCRRVVRTGLRVPAMERRSKLPEQASALRGSDGRHAKARRASSPPGTAARGGVAAIGQRTRSSRISAGGSTSWS